MGAWDDCDAVPGHPGLQRRFWMTGSDVVTSHAVGVIGDLSVAV
jgi:hypothetical protein